jgi:hypothetical protein
MTSFLRLMRWRDVWWSQSRLMWLIGELPSPRHAFQMGTTCIQVMVGMQLLE